MTPDERIIDFIHSLDGNGRAVMCFVLWVGLRQRLCTNDRPDEWAAHIEQRTVNEIEKAKERGR